MKRFSGFSLIEMSIVLILLSLVAGGGLHALNYHVQRKRDVTTQDRLREAKAALLHFVQVHGHLPCPALAIAPTEQRRIGGWEQRTADGRCQQYDGFLPALTLGLPETDDQGYWTDGWNRRSNRIRYALAQTVYATTGDQRCSPTEGGGTDISAFLVSDKESDPLSKPYWGKAPFNQPLRRLGLCVCDSVKCTDTPGLGAAAVMYSLGANGFLDGAGAGSSPDEQENLNQDRFFVARTVTQTFDDTVVWISSDALWGALLEVGALRPPAVSALP